MEWGADCLEPERNFWGIYFPEDVQKVSPPGSIPVELECAVCRSREIQELSPDQFNTLAKLGALTRDCSKCGTATEWQFAFVEAEGEAPVPPPPEPGPMAVSPPKGIENRRQKRLALRLHVRISYEDGRAENTMTEDVSKSGICCASNLAMKVADAVTLTFEPGQETGEEETPARIAWRRPVGETGRALYGIMLEEINHKLNGVIEDFSSP
ncbi:MAG: hypothetical protein DMG21_04475 [Acidobacteria bacterium]|nr:MAG: hypothetical protein DMG21_04475 [Acidobacteriota bacterium]